MRDGAAALLDHVAKEMNELNLERCKCIPTNTPGADWRCLEAIVRDDPSREKFKARALALKFLQHMRPGQCAACRLAPSRLAAVVHQAEEPLCALLLPSALPNGW